MHNTNQLVFYEIKIKYRFTVNLLYGKHRGKTISNNSR